MIEKKMEEQNKKSKKETSEPQARKKKVDNVKDEIISNIEKVQ